jgi:uncharacterized protein YjhX (UPF0386 family)
MKFDGVERNMVFFSDLSRNEVIQILEQSDRIKFECDNDGMVLIVGSTSFLYQGFRSFDIDLETLEKIIKNQVVSSVGITKYDNGREYVTAIVTINHYYELSLTAEY